VLQTTVQLRQVVPLLVLERAVKVLVLVPLALAQLVPEQLEQELLATEPRVPELLVLERPAKVLVLEPLALEQLVPEQLVPEQLVPEQLVPEQLEQELLATEPRVPEPLELELLASGLQELELAKDRELVSRLMHKDSKHEC
jgi:hypothetical protein